MSGATRGNCKIFLCFLYKFNFQRQKEYEEEFLRKRLKDKKRAATIARIKESENLLKFLLVDEVIRQEWEKEQRKKPAEKVREYVKANKLPGEHALREKLMKKRELAMRSQVRSDSTGDTVIYIFQVVKKTFDQGNEVPQTKKISVEELALADAINRDLTKTQYDIHRQRQRMYKECQDRRDQLLRETEHRLQKFRSKFKDDSVFDRQKIVSKSDTKSITINIKTKSIDEYIEKNKNGV